MSLIKCPECNKEISDTSNTCIHCGYKLKEISNLSRNKKILILSVISILIILLFIIIKNVNKGELPYCYDNDYFYKQMRDEIYDEYWQYDFIDIEYCDSRLLNGELDAWCHFKYKKNKDNNYVESDFSKTFYCSHSQ
ncbi:MAG: zinc ribbon domain-containing protein [Bacilli bacterium]|nr:zinc ribbon domain-containing protein [Bacilli bacterium]